MKRLFALLLALAGVVTPVAVRAQASASPFTSGTRYDLAGRVVGTIAPDPDGAGPLAHAAVRNSYDVNGWLTSDGSVTLTYDAENRLVTATGAKTANMVYDPLGRLYETSGAGVTRFLYDGIGVYRRCRRNCRHIWPRVLQM